jgi:hypothetical protein
MPANVPFFGTYPFNPILNDIVSLLLSKLKSEKGTICSPKELI